MSKSYADEFARELISISTQVMALRSREALFESLVDGCWIYGAGGYGRTIKRLLKNAGVCIRGFVDQRGADADRDGTLDAPVAQPAEIDRATAAQSTLVVALHNFTVDQGPIVAWARELGFRDILMSGELPDLLGREAGSYWLTSRRHVLDNIDNLVSLLPRLADDRSRAVVSALARFRATGLPEHHPDSCIDDQYFPTDLPPPDRPVSLLDGGAYVGDTHEAALRHGVRIDEWLAFEPAPDNFQALARYAATADIGRAALFPCGLGDRFEVLRFAGDAGAGSRAVTDGSQANLTTVHVVAADEVLKGARPTMVKLDVEGFERQALDGMRAIIAQNRPRMAVSIYHEPADLWELPAKVAEMLPGARLYVRQHGESGFDTVLYALPD